MSNCSISTDNTRGLSVHLSTSEYRLFRGLTPLRALPTRPYCHIDVQIAPTRSHPRCSQVLFHFFEPLSRGKRSIDILALHFNFTTWIIPEGTLAIWESPGHKGSRYTQLRHYPHPKIHSSTSIYRQVALDTASQYAEIGSASAFAEIYCIGN